MFWFIFWLVIEVVTLSFAAYNTLGAVLNKGQDPRMWTCYWMIYIILIKTLSFDSTYYIRIVLSIVFAVPVLKFSVKLFEGFNKHVVSKTDQVKQLGSDLIKSKLAKKE